MSETFLAKLDGIPLLVEEISWRSGQRVSYIRPPAAPRIPQDWGPERDFALRGFIPASSGLSGAFRLDGIKDARKPVLLQIDANSWMVQCESFDFTEDPGSGEVSFFLALAEVKRPKTLVFVVGAENEGGLAAQVAIEALRQRISAFNWRGLADRISAAIASAVERVAEVRELLSDGIGLVNLPAAVIGQVERAAGQVVAQVDLVSDQAGELLSGTRTYSDDEESLKEIVQLCASVRREMALLGARCQAVPREEQTLTLLEGETLQRAAARWNLTYGADLDWVELARANGIEDPGAVEAGLELVVPG